MVDGARILRGALVGYVASRCMDAATSWFYEQQSARSKDREEEIAPGGTLVQLGKQLGQAAGRELDDEQGGRVGLVMHRTLGTTYGMIAAALVGRGVPPLTAGLAVGAGAFVLVDEGTALPALTDYPLVSHARGVVGHATIGTVIGVLLALTEERGATRGWGRRRLRG